MLRGPRRACSKSRISLQSKVRTNTQCPIQWAATGWEGPGKLADRSGAKAPSQGDDIRNLRVSCVVIFILGGWHVAGRLHRDERH